MKITIPAESYPLLRAAQVCAAKDDVRYYLNGIYIEPSRGRITGTDGYRMFRAVAFPPTEGEPFIAHFEGSLPNRKNTAVEIERSSDAGLSGLAYVGGKPVAWTAMGGRYPDVDRVFPETDDTQPAGAFNPALIAPVAKELGAKGVYLHPAASGGGVYSVEFVRPETPAGTVIDCVLMGVRK